MNDDAIKPCIAFLTGFLLSVPVAAAQPVELPAKQDFHIYLLMGQSNMAGRDTSGLNSQINDPRILALDADGEWRVARDPIHAKTGRIEPGVGPGISFAIAIQRQTPEVTIGLVPCGIGGTSIECWQKGKRCYDEAIARTRLVTGHGILRGVLWHQGESDSTSLSRAVAYEERLCRMIADLRRDLGVNHLPFVLGQVGEFLEPERFPHAATVRKAIRQVANSRQRVGYAGSEALCDLGDNLHFSAEASQELGRRYARAMGQLLDAEAKQHQAVSVTQ